MMEPIRFIMLFSVVIFSAYCMHEAQKDVSRVRASQNRQLKMNNSIHERDTNFMNRAIALSHISQEQHHGDPFGSVVVKGGKVVGEGMNRTQLLQDPSAHAEVEAIRDACKNLKVSSLTGCSIYTSAQPCPMCLSLIYLTGIEKVYYCIPGDRIDSIGSALPVAHIYEAIKKPSVDRPIPEIAVLPNQITQIIDRYNKPE
jgi:guanine deaminase